MGWIWGSDWYGCSFNILSITNQRIWYSEAIYFLYTEFLRIISSLRLWTIFQTVERDIFCIPAIMRVNYLYLKVRWHPIILELNARLKKLSHTFTIPSISLSLQKQNCHTASAGRIVRFTTVHLSCTLETKMKTGSYFGEHPYLYLTLPSSQLHPYVFCTVKTGIYKWQLFWPSLPWIQPFQILPFLISLFLQGNSICFTLWLTSDHLPVLSKTLSN